MEMSFERAWNEMTGRQHHAFHMKVWDALGDPKERAENFRRLMTGELRLTVEEVARVLFDRHGRRIPPQGIKASVVDANRNFCLDQKVMKLADYGLRLTLAAGYLGRSIAIDPEEFVDRTSALRERIRGDEQLANLLHGVHLPIALPQIEISDYGTALEEVFLPAVGRAYEIHFAGRKFHNGPQENLRGKVQVVGSHSQYLVAGLAEMPVVALYFPTALQGFSAEAAREQMVTLPDRDRILLAGALETAVAIVMYPDILARDGQTPNLGCAAVTWQGYLPCFRARDGEFFFDAGVGNDGACGGFSSGIVVLG